MNGVYDVAKLTEFDCWGCCSKIKCEIGSMDCVAVKMSKIACDMIMDGGNYEVSQDYCKPIEHNYTDVRIPF
jgi:hypothetical protein